MVLVFSVFSSPCLLNNAVDLRRAQAPVPVSSIHCFLNFSEAFSGSGEIGDEGSHPHHMWAGGVGAALDRLWAGLVEHS
jgi:hypothetical protein